MIDCHTLIDEAIAQYQLIFNSSEAPVGDRRLSCELDPEVFLCHGIDKIQLCVRCIVGCAELSNELRWIFKESEEKYYFYPYFYPTADKEFEDALKSYAECNLHKIYLKNESLTTLYRTCEGYKTESSPRTCDILTDMVFNMNRRGRNKEELDKFNALFCCTNIGVLQNFLFEARKQIESLDDSKRLIFLREITLFLNKVFSIRKYIDGNEKGNDICNELRDSCAIASAIVSCNQRPKAIQDNLAKKFEKKLMPTFAESSSWKYTKNMCRQGNCRDIYRSLANICFPNISFDNTRNSDTIEIGRRDVSTVITLLDEKIKNDEKNF